MKAHTLSLINAVVLFVMGSWAFFDSEFQAFTPLIPSIFGVMLILINGGVKSENKVIAHIAVTLTLIILLGLIRPLMGVLERGEIIGIIRVTSMIGTSALAMVGFIKSFIDARKAREAQAV